MQKKSTTLKLDKRGRLKLSERAIQRQIIDLLEAHGWLVLRTNQFKSGGAIIVQGAIEKGIPDLQARRLFRLRSSTCLSIEKAYWLFWIEVKRPGGKLSADQERWHLLAKRRGETVLTAESVEQVAEAIGVRIT